MTLTTQIRTECDVTSDLKDFFKKLSIYAECPDFIEPTLDIQGEEICISNPMGVGAKLWVQLTASSRPLLEDDEQNPDVPLFNKAKTIILLDTTLRGGSNRTTIFIEQLMKDYPHIKFFARNEMTGEWFENKSPYLD